MNPIQGLQGATGALLGRLSPAPAARHSVGNTSPQAVPPQAAPTQTAAARPSVQVAQNSYAPTMRHSAMLRAQGSMPTRGSQPTNATNLSPSMLTPQTPNPAGASVLSGDLNGDGSVNAADAQELLAYLFQGGNAPQQMANADANGDGKVNLADVVRIFQLSSQNGSNGPTTSTP